MKYNSVNESTQKDNRDTETPGTMEECLKLLDELKVRQSELEWKLKEKNSRISKLHELNTSIVEYAESIIITTDLEGIITSFNPFAEKMLGYRAEEVIGKYTPLLFYDPKEFMQFSETDSSEVTPGYSLNFEEILIQKFKEKKQSKGVERVFVKKDGSRFKGLLTVNKIDGERGKTKGYVGVVVDINKRKLAEEQFIRSENENRAIIKAIPDRLFKIRKDGTYRNFKNQIIDPLNNPKDRFHRKNIGEVISGELLQKTNEQLQKALITKEVANFEYGIRLNEKEERFYESRMIAISEEEVLSIVRDVTDSKLNERYSIIHRDLGYALASTSSIELALSQVIKAMLQIEGVDAAGVYLLDESSKDFELVVSESAYPEYGDLFNRHYKKKDLQKTAFERKEPVYGLPDQITDDSELPLHGHFKQFEIHPIKYEDTIIALVNIATSAKQKLSNSSRIAVEMLASQIGGTLSRIKSENALRQSQNNFHLIFDTLNDFVFIFNPEGKIIHTNPTVGKNLGYAAEELRGMSVLDLHPREWKEEVESVLNEILKQQSTVYAIPLVKRNGSQIPVETKVVHGKWNEENVLYSISRDVTERYKAEAELKMQSEAFEAFALSIIITDINGNIQWANSSFSEMSGYTMADILGKNPSQIVKSGKQNSDFYKEMWDTILRGEVWRGELINRRKDGSTFSEELTITPVKDHSGKISNFMAIKIDVTKRKEMEDALRMSEERWHFALEGSGDGVFDRNLVTDEIFFSEQWKIMLGYSASEIENKYEEWEKRVHPDDLESCLADFENHLSGKSLFYANEHRMRCKDGSYKWILARGKIVERTADGKPSRIIGTHKDVTDRKLEEEQLRKNIETEKELNDLKSRFVAMASHEFRTPLASILMISETLIYHHRKMDSTQLNERLTKIKNHVFHLTNIVSDVLQLSRIQEGKAGFNPMNVDMIAICLTIIDEFKSTDRLKDGQISFNSPFNRWLSALIGD